VGGEGEKGEHGNIRTRSGMHLCIYVCVLDNQNGQNMRVFPSADKTILSTNPLYPLLYPLLYKSKNYMEGESLNKNRQKALARHDKFIMVLPSADKTILSTNPLYNIIF
jgi:hypothetical protein